MLRINPVQINSINDPQKPSSKTAPIFTSASKPIADATLPEVRPDYAVKTPITYQKISALELPFDTKANLYKLSNGQRIVIIPREGETVLKTYVNTGSMNEPDNVRGISHYIEHNLFNGSEGLEAGEFFKKVDKMGASTNASTGFAETNYYISSHLLNKDDLEQKIKLHASMLETPRFATERLEKEKGIVNSEINMILSDPQNLGINKTLKNLYSINSTSQDIIGGTTSNITNLTRENVVDYFSKNYYPANMVTVITGEIDSDKTMQLISKYFASNKRPSTSRNFEELKPIDKPIREDIISDKATATSVMLGFNGPANNNAKDKTLTDALAMLLTMSKTSRIDKNIKKYNSSTMTSIEKISTKPTDGRAIVIMANSTEDNSEKIIKTIYNEIASLENNPPTDEEMIILKKRMLKDFSNIFERSGNVNSITGEAFLDNDLNYLTNYEKTIKEMTSADLVETAKKYLNINKAALTVVHPASATTETIKTNHKNAANITFTGTTEPKKAINMTTVKEYRLDNNFAVVTQDIKTNNASFDILYSAKDYPKDTKPATSVILHRLLNAGTGTKNEQEFGTELDKAGITTVFVSGDTDLKAKSYFASEDAEKALKTAKEVLLNPRFQSEAFEKCKSEILDDILTSEKNASDKLAPELYKGIPSGSSKDDILKSLGTTTLEDVKKLYDYIIQNGQANIVISAPFSKNPELKQLVFNEIAELPKVEPKNYHLKKSFRPIEETKVLTDTSTKPQAEIIQSFKFKSTQNLQDEVALNLLNTILGGGPSSRLFDDLREKQKLAYAVRSGISYIDDIGTVSLKIKTTTENKDTTEVSYENVQKCIDGFKKHIEKLKTEKVTEGELNNAKLSFKNSILSSNETNTDKNVSLEYGLMSPYGLNQENIILDTIDKITADDLYNAANNIFAGKPLYSILATENTLKNNEEYLNKLSA